jgi:hypothetical protein
MLRARIELPAGGRIDRLAQLDAATIARVGYAAIEADHATGLADLAAAFTSEGLHRRTGAYEASLFVRTDQGTTLPLVVRYGATVPYAAILDRGRPPLKRRYRVAHVAVRAAGPRVRERVRQALVQYLLTGRGG